MRVIKIMSWQYQSIIFFIIFFPKSLDKPTVACHKCFVSLQKVCDEPLWTNNIYCVQTCTLFHFIFVTHFVAQFLKAVFSSQNMWRNVPYLFIIVWELVFIFHKFHFEFLFICHLKRPQLTWCCFLSNYI